jgi:hypothetical protein
MKRTMKRTALIALLVTLAAAAAGRAQPECPLNMRGDPYPGNCMLFTDKNGDGLCDFSQELKKTAPQQQAVDTQAGAQKRGQSRQTTPTGASAVPNNPRKEDTAPSHEPVISVAVAAGGDDAPLAGAGPPSYFIWQQLAVILALALLSEFWQRRNRTSTFRVQTVWNWLLLASFILSAATGCWFLLPVRWRAAVGLNILYWHTVTSLCFIYIGLYHGIRRFGTMWRGLRCWLGLAQKCEQPHT